MKKDMEERVARLEENAWFQDTHLKDLDDQLLAQQRQLDAFERELANLRAQIAKIRNLSQEIELQADSADADSLPPHYQSVIWHEL